MSVFFVSFLMAFTQPAAKDIPSCRRGPEGRTHTVQLCSILNNLKYQHCTHTHSHLHVPSLLTVTSPIPSYAQVQTPTSTQYPPLLAFPALARRSLGALRARRRIHARRSPRLRIMLAYTHTHTRYVNYVTLRLRLRCTHACTHAAKHRDPTHPVPVPDLLVTVIMADAVCLPGCWGCQVC
jgi:hypothetical protein